MKGYKGFNPDWTCRDFQFEVGKVFEMDAEPICCKQGFHFCKKLADCFDYYRFSPDNKFAEIEAIGDIVFNDESKYCTNKIKIVRELSWYEVLNLVNSGRYCTGYRNTGNFNNGVYNSGSYNTGNYNFGSNNTGYCNFGSNNVGNCNFGSNNTGNCNSGRYNSGDYNITNYSSGCFNTIEQKIFFFNKPSDWTLWDWLKSGARQILSSSPLNNPIWVNESNMSEKEKEEHPEYSIMGGFLKYVEEESKRQYWWDNLSEQSKRIIMKLPNFDKDIFKEITGIDVEL